MDVSYRVKAKPDGWFEPWMLVWQLRHCRPRMNFKFEALDSWPYGRVGWRVSTWHCWQRRGLATLSIFSWFEPWGSWQFVQLSVTGACSQRKGSRFSAWQVKQVSLVDIALRLCCVTPPCGLWQDVHVILPSRSGMWEDRIC